MKTTKTFSRMLLGSVLVVFGCLALKAAGEPLADAGSSVSVGKGAAEKLTPELESRQLARDGKFAEAEDRLARKEDAEKPKDELRNLRVALELWGMAREARNEARFLEAVELASRTKRLLAKAIKAAETQEETAHIARMLYELTQQFPLSEREVEDRHAEWIKASEVHLAGGASK